MQETHYLDIRIAIDFSTVLNRKNIQGVKLLLNEKNEEELIPSYARYLRDILENVLKEREELYIKAVTLSDKDDIEGFEDSEQPLLDSGIDSSEEVSNDVTTLLASQLEEISDMKGVILSKIEVKESVVFDQGLISDEVDIQRNIKTFEEESLYQAYIPYRLTIMDSENKETILLGGF